MKTPIVPRALALIGLLVLVAAVLSTPALAGGKKYGEGIGSEETVKISALLEKADDYVGKTVRVEGRVLDVCQKRGCWMELASDKEFETIRIKVTDGVIVFPMDAKGQYAIAEGELAKIELTLEQTINYKQHHAEEQGEEFDPASVTEAEVFYQIMGTGAVIENRPAEKGEKKAACIDHDDAHS